MYLSYHISYDSTLALALVILFGDLCKVTNLFQRMEFESISCSPSICDISLVGIDIPSWIVGDIITAVPLLSLHTSISTIDNGLFCFQPVTTKEDQLVLLRTGIHILIIAKADLPITLKAFAAISAQPLQQNLPQSTIQVVELLT